MGEDRQSGRRVAVDEAARHLGLTVDAVRKRVQRGQIAYEKDEAGRVRIILDEGETLQDESPDTTEQDAGAHADLVEELRNRVHYLERVLEDEREARTEERRRHDTLMAQLMQRIPQLEASPEAPEAAETSEEQQGRGQPAPMPRALRRAYSAACSSVGCLAADREVAMERDGAEFRADLSWANLGGAELLRADMSHTNLIRVDLDGADLTDAYLGITNEELERRAKSLKGTIMPNGQKYEDWLKSKGRAEDG